MENIPVKPEANILKGVWFVWHDGSNVISAWASTVSGKEKVYINGKLASEKRNLKINSVHQFEDADKNLYEVGFDVSKIFRGIIECQFKKNGELKKKYLCRFAYGRMFSVKNLGLFLAGFVIVLILHIIFTLPEPVIFISMLVILALIYGIGIKEHNTIEEVNV